MTTDYNPIAGEYKQSKLQPWRTHIECFSLMELVGDLSRLSVLDVACGEGYYTRLLRRRGAEAALGVDLSTGMIELARALKKTPIDWGSIIGSPTRETWASPSRLIWPWRHTF